MSQTNTSTCRDCGTTLYWADTATGGRHRALERWTGRERLLLIDSNGVVQPLKDTYVPHDCKWARWKS